MIFPIYDKAPSYICPNFTVPIYYITYFLKMQAQDDEYLKFLLKKAALFHVKQCKRKQKTNLLQVVFLMFHVKHQRYRQRKSLRVCFSAVFHVEHID